ncbi:MAG: YraN family protein [Rikenellaceae bacterium]|nr:YraN family protein [Rikenellaceae bacterium]
MAEGAIDRARIGRLGEEATVAYLRRNGYEICARNWREGHYELDIVARKRGVLHLVEVKTRKAEGLTTPLDAMHPDKIRALHRAAARYMATAGRRYDGYEVQFDLAAVEIDTEERLQIDFIEQVAQYDW